MSVWNRSVVPWSIALTLIVCLTRVLIHDRAEAATGPVAGYAFDEGVGKAAFDASGNNNTGKLSVNVAWGAGKYGSAVALIGNNDHVDLGNPQLLNITGSITISAWINSRFFPFDDAPIVSKLDARTGYQLDTTIDKGPRTIAFKLTNSQGASMIRYGSTALTTGTWYHVAGVYDANKQTIDVYLNGKPDNGVLVGVVTSTQKNSSQNVNIGRRPGWTKAVFAGLLDDVRIYSRALTGTEIIADMNTPLGGATIH